MQRDVVIWEKCKKFLVFSMGKLRISFSLQTIHEEYKARQAFIRCSTNFNLVHRCVSDESNGTTDKQQSCGHYWGGLSPINSYTRNLASALTPLPSSVSNRLFDRFHPFPTY
ncbi:hypothetical protein DVH05_003584 [Phytophthora capsici]|nr:hypothetical protein DVH05_003584 [Phytophthora capsici]